MRVWLCAFGVVMAAGAVPAVELQLPASARQVIVRDTSQDQYIAPIGPFADGKVAGALIEGTVARSAWRVDVAGLTPLQLITPLRSQLIEAGYSIVLDCAAQECGGYDFRFGTEVLPAPEMYVNIRNFHVITAVRGDEVGVKEAVSVLASASSGASYVQIVQAGDMEHEASVRTVGTTPQPTRRAATDAPVATLDDTLIRDGHVVLGGLKFASGTSELSEGPFATLDTLVEVLRVNPDMALALVGHTDNVGSLQANIELSRNRARAVRQHLITHYGVAPARLEADGTGYLVPLTSNATAEGREANRRVEAVVLAR